MKWLFKPRLNLVDGLSIVIGATLLVNGYPITGALVLTLGPALSSIGETVFKVKS